MEASQHVLKFEDVDVFSLIQKSIDRLIENDGYMLCHDLNERTITGQLARYLQNVFEGWHVDCEYNRNHDDPKRLKLPVPRMPVRSAFRDTLARTVFPDIIVHKRGSADNFIVLEVKKTTSEESDDFDLAKLKAFKSQLGYVYAVFLRLGTAENVGFFEIKNID